MSLKVNNNNDRPRDAITSRSKTSTSPLSSHCKTYVLLLAFAILFVTSAAQDKLEGESCSMPSSTTLLNVSGVCTPASECTTIDEEIRLGKLVSKDVRSCGLGVHEEIVCCPLGTATVGVKLGARATTIACERIETNLTIQLSPHILGGIKADKDEYPHMAAIAFPSIAAGSNFTFRCGGTLIDERFVLTAAHCVNDNESPPLFVRLGVINRNSVGVDIRIRAVHVHTNFTTTKKGDDIAILELESPAVYSASVFPACLYSEEADPPDSYQYYVAGWGETNTRTRDTSDVLLKARLDIVPFDTCREIILKDYENLLNIRSTQMCAQDTKNYTKDACHGDSGGPLIMIYNATKKSYRVVGIISAGIGCASRIPGLYTRVSAYLDFIESIVWPSLRK